MKAGRLLLIVFVACTLAAAAVLTYKRWPRVRNSLSQEPATSSNQAPVSVPPFSTKEPERYRATRIINSMDDDPDPPLSSVTRVLIARDGDKRREDYDGDTDYQTSFLETPAGTFVLLPSKKLYAEISAGSDSLRLLEQQGEAATDFSPEELLNEPTSARYEKLGNEKLDGRNTTKYRVTNLSTNATEAPTVTLIWIDDALAMPIRSETEVSDGNHRSKLTTELRDIELQVDPKLFELPKEFKRVESAELRNWLKQLRTTANRETPKP